VHFYTVVNPTTGLAELHTSSPVNDATLTLIGSNGVLDFTPLKNPAAVTVPVGTTVDWTSFELDEGTPGEGTVKYVGKEGRWVMFPEGDEWELKWRSGESWCLSACLLDRIAWYDANLMMQRMLGRSRLTFPCRLCMSSSRNRTRRLSREGSGVKGQRSEPQQELFAPG